MKNELNESLKKFSPVFNYLTKDMDDWKEPIKSFIPISVWNKYKLSKRVVSEATNFFTATSSVVTFGYNYIFDDHWNSEGGYWVECDGYRNGPAGDR